MRINTEEILGQKEEEKIFRRVGFTSIEILQNMTWSTKAVRVCIVFYILLFSQGCKANIGHVLNLEAKDFIVVIFRGVSNTISSFQGVRWYLYDV